MHSQHLVGVVGYTAAQQAVTAGEACMHSQHLVGVVGYTAAQQAVTTGKACMHSQHTSSGNILPSPKSATCEHGCEHG
jgi:hypothetical protein